MRTFLFSLGFLAFGFALSGCDTQQPPPTPPPAPPEPEPEPPQVIGYDRFRVDGVRVYGVVKEEADGSVSYVLSDNLKGVFRFGVYADLTHVLECREDADVCRSETVGTADRAAVLFDRPIVVGGVVREAGTDVSDNFDVFERDWLRSPYREPTPIFHVGFDTTAVRIPAGEIGLTVRWERSAFDDLEVTRRFEYDPVARD